MHTVETSLATVLGSEGVVGVTLVDAVTGLSYGAVGDSSAVGDALHLSEVANLITDRLHQAGAEGELESVIVTSRHWHHITQVVPRSGGSLLLSVALDRERTNLALAIRQLAGHAEDVLA